MNITCGSLVGTRIPADLKRQIERRGVLYSHGPYSLFDVVERGDVFPPPGYFGVKAQHEAYREAWERGEPGKHVGHYIDGIWTPL